MLAQTAVIDIQVKMLNWQDEDTLLFEVLFPLIQGAALAGAQTALGDMLEIGVGLDWGLVNQAVVDWARSYTFDLVRGINDTTRRFLQSEIAEWVESGAPLDSLREGITPMFGPVRAEMIAVTEVTRSFAEGNLVSWRESGVVDGVQWMTAQDELVCPICQPLSEKKGTLDGGIDGLFPPAHVRCRCYLQPVVMEA